MTHEEEADTIVNSPMFNHNFSMIANRTLVRDAIATALRKRDELYDAAWAELEEWRFIAGKRTSAGKWKYQLPDGQWGWMPESDAHDTLRREAGKEKA